MFVRKMPRIKVFPSFSNPDKHRLAITRHVCHQYDTYRVQMSEFDKIYYAQYDNYKNIPGSNPATFIKIVEDYMVKYEKNVYDFLLSHRWWTFEQVEENIRFTDFFSETVNSRLASMLDVWRDKYGAPVKEWTTFTKDRQNVHTTVVTNTMNDGVTILRTFQVPVGQKTVDEIVTAFINELRLGGHQIATVYKDMIKWGKVSSIFQDNDYLYRQVLRGLWAKIKTYSGDLRTELIQRLWEECSEAAGLCATGHISRLTNVLVGFDEAFKPQISFKETFQNTMAQISQMDVEEDEKVRLATKAMDELDVPLEERQVWLDAF